MALAPLLLDRLDQCSWHPRDSLPTVDLGGDSESGPAIGQLPPRFIALPRCALACSDLRRPQGGRVMVLGFTRHVGTPFRIRRVRSIRDR